MINCSSPGHWGFEACNGSPDKWNGPHRWRHKAPSCIPKSHQWTWAVMKGEVCSQEFYLCRSILREPEHAFQSSFRERSDSIGTKKAQEIMISQWFPGSWREIHTVYAWDWSVHVPALGLMNLAETVPFLSSGPNINAVCLRLLSSCQVLLLSLRNEITQDLKMVRIVFA